MSISDTLGIVAVSIAFVAVLFAVGAAVAAVIGSDGKDEEEGGGK